MTTNKILLIDDHQLLVDGLEALIINEFGFNIDKAITGKDAISMIAFNTYKAIITDISLPDRSGLELVEFAKERSHAPIMVYTMHNEIDVITEAMRKGAIGYVLKSDGKSELLQAIKSIVNGEEYFSADVRKIIERINARKSHVHDVISSREIEIIRFIAGGFTSKEIGDKLDISERTVETHRRNIMKKTGCKSAAQVVDYARKEGLI
jgi:DNA-binding NarL/FixJ family response regulator